MSDVCLPSVVCFVHISVTKGVNSVTIVVVDANVLEMCVTFVLLQC